MKRAQLVSKMLLLVALVCFLGSCTATNTTSTASTDNTTKKERRNKRKEPAFSPVGAWEYVVETPDGASGGIMRITGDPGTYEAVLETDQFGTIDVEGLEIVGTTLSGYFDVAGISVEIDCEFDGDTMSGSAYVGDDVYPLEGSRTSN